MRLGRQVEHERKNLEDVVLRPMAPFTCHRCCQGDTDIFTNNGIFKAKDLLDCAINTVDDNLKIIIKNCKRVEKKESKLLLLKTRSGYEIKITPDHKFYTIDGWVEAKDLNTDKKIATVRKWEINEKEILPLNIVIGDVKHPPIFNSRIVIDENFAYFVGTFLGDGDFNAENNNIMGITTSHSAVEQNINNICINAKIHVCKIKSSNCKTSYRYDFANKQLKEFLLSHGAPHKNIKNGKKGHDKSKSRNIYIDNIFLTAKKSLLANLIAGYFDTDGNIGKERIRFVSVSPKMLKTLQYALLRFGIISSFYEIKRYKEACENVESGKWSKAYGLSISGNNIGTFYDCINSRVQYKLDKLKFYALNRKYNKTNYDTIPITEKIIIVRKKLKIPTYIYSDARKRARETGCDRSKFKTEAIKLMTNFRCSDPSKDLLLKIISEFEKYGTCPELDELRKYANSDILWDKIVSIEEAEIETVYDFQVEDTHNFIGNGFVLHNSISNRFKYIAPPDVPPEVGPDEILLGYEKPDYTEGDKLVTMKFDGKSVVFGILGSRGSGKCLSKNTDIFTDSGIFKISDFDSAKMNTMDKYLKIILKDGKLVEKKEAPLLKIKTRHGYDIKATHDHKFYTTDGWVEAKDLKIDNQIATVRKWEVNEKEPPVSNIIVPVNEDFAYFVGAFLGDGSFCPNSNGIRITTSKRTIIEVIQKNAKLFGVNCISVKHGNTYDTKIHHKDLREYLLQHGAPYVYQKNGVKGNKCANIFIHNDFLCAPKNILAALIAGYFDTDGYIANNGQEVEFSSKSKRMIETLRYALLRFGIISYIKEKKVKYKGEERVYHKLMVYGNDLIIFFEQIKPRFKEISLEDLEIIKNKKQNANFDTIPITQKIRKVFKILNVPFYICSDSHKQAKKNQCSRNIFKTEAAKLMSGFNECDPSPEKLKRIISEFEKYGTCSELDELRKYANSDILWDKIISIEEAGIETVYDFQVEDTHNFVGNGIVLHNSVLATNIALDQLFSRWNIPIAFIDPQWEFSVRRTPQQNPVLRSTLRKLGFRPRGYNMYVATPKFLSGLGNAEHQYIIDMRDVKQIMQVDRSAGLTALLELFELESAGTASPRRQIVQAVMADNCPDSIFELRKKVADIVREKRKSQVTGIETKRPVSMMAIDIIDNLIYPGIVGCRKQSEILDIPKVMHDYSNFCLQLSLGGGKDAFLCAYLKFAIYQIIFNRMKYVRETSRMHVNMSGNTDAASEYALTSGAAFVIDEIDKFAPAGYNTPARYAITELATKYRKLGISVIFISQKPQNVFPPLIGEADALLVSKIQTNEEKGVLRARGVPNHIIENVIQNLKSKVETESGHKVSEWALIKSDNTCVTFYPCPPRSSILEEAGA